MSKYKEKLLKLGDYYVMVATHPQRPNHDQHARGRSQHLAVSRKRGTLTLCNMMVSFPYPNWGEDRLTRPCLNCMERVTAKAYSPPPLPEHSYSFTINTDASHTDKGNIGAWACWIKSSHYLIKEAGLFPMPVPNSSVAELMAFEQALLLLDRLVSSQDFLRHHRDKGKILLYVNTDSLWTIHALQGVIKRSKHLAIARRIKSLTEDYIVIARHVKGHSGVQDTRSWVNRWCDTQAKGLLRKRIEELNGRPEK